LHWIGIGSFPLAGKPADEEEDAERKATILRKKRENDERLEVMLGYVNTSLLSDGQIIQHEMLKATNNLSGAYYATISGGNYPETIKLIDKKLPDSKSGVRTNLAQQVLHQQMVDSQYNNNNGEQ
jgi:hypothetical protein